MRIVAAIIILWFTPLWADAQPSDLLRLFPDDVEVVITAEIKSTLETPAAKLLLDETDLYTFVEQIALAQIDDKEELRKFPYRAFLKRLIAATERAAVAVKFGEPQGFAPSFDSGLLVLEGKYNVERMKNEIQLLAENASHDVEIVGNRIALRRIDGQKPDAEMMLLSDSLVLFGMPVSTAIAEKRVSNAHVTTTGALGLIRKHEPTKHALCAVFEANPDGKATNIPVDSFVAFLDVGKQVVTKTTTIFQTDEAAREQSPSALSVYSEAADHFAHLAISKSLRQANATTTGKTIETTLKIPIRELAATVEQLLEGKQREHAPPPSKTRD